MKIVIEVIPHAAQRYPTVGNWQVFPSEWKRLEDEQPMYGQDAWVWYSKEAFVGQYRYYANAKGWVANGITHWMPVVPPEPPDSSSNPENKHLKISVSKLPLYQETLLVAVHELVETILCMARGISSEDIDKWDFNFDGDGEPGDHPDACYHKEHTFATAIERQLAEALRLDWKEYNTDIENLFLSPPVSSSNDDIPF
jgi:hypothetical protein